MDAFSGLPSLPLPFPKPSTSTSANDQTKPQTKNKQEQEQIQNKNTKPVEKHHKQQPQEKEKEKEKEGFNSSVPPKTVNFWLVAFIYFILCAILFHVFEAFISEKIVGIVFDQGETSKNFIKYLADRDYRNDRLASLPSDMWSQIDSELTMSRFAMFFSVTFGLIILNYACIYHGYLGGTQDSLAFQILTVCFLGIMGIIFLLCNNVSFVKIFENTIGYAYVDSLFSFFPNSRNNATLDDFMKHRIFDSKTNPVQDMKQLGAKYDFLFTLFRLDNFGHVLREILTHTRRVKTTDTNQVGGGTDGLTGEGNVVMGGGGGGGGGVTDTNLKYPFVLNSKLFEATDRRENNFRHLIRLIIKKHMIGHITWIFFGMFMSTVIASKYLVKYTH